MKLPVIIIGAVVVALLAAGGGFFGGMAYAQSQAQRSANTFLEQRAAQNGQGGAQGGAQANANDPCGLGRGGQDRTSGQTNGTSGQSGQGNAQGGTQRQGGQSGGGQFGGQFGNPAQFGNCVARGQVKSVNGNTVEISTANSVITVKVSDQTLISKTGTGTLSDLQPGDRITVFSKDTGDSPTATMLQLQKAVPQQQQQ